MTIEQLGVQIGMPAEAITCAQRMLPAPADTKNFLLLLDRDEPAFLKTLKTMEKPNQLALALFMQYAAEQAEKWVEKGLSERIYVDTMRDLTLWYRECMRKTGEPGLIEWDWLCYSLKGRLLRLGRLQYQPRRLRESLVVGGDEFAAGAVVLEVHIPADGKLDRLAVADSLKQARRFFARGGYTLFHCHSWLLSPALHRLLPDGSNILSFQNFFCIYDEDFYYREAEERVFGYIGQEISEYPETTHLQKTLKNFLRAGGKVGLGKGIILFQTN